MITLISPLFSFSANAEELGSIDIKASYRTVQAKYIPPYGNWSRYQAPTWSWGDGTGIKGNNNTHTYIVNGLYNITCDVPNSRKLYIVVNITGAASPSIEGSGGTSDPLLSDAQWWGLGCFVVSGAFFSMAASGTRIMPRRWANVRAQAALLIIAAFLLALYGAFEWGLLM